MRAQRIKLNLIPGGVIPVVNVSQYDVGRPLEFALYDGPTVATIAAGTVIDIRATKPDGTGFEYACTWSNNIVSIATQAQMTVLSGSIECELHMVKDSQEIGTANFILEVEAAALRSDTVISETEIPDIIDAARSSASAAATSESNAEAYAIGKRGGVDVTSGDPAYQNNSKYYSESAGSSASAAATSESNAEAYAIGKRGGVDVTSGDPTYQNNSKYYSEVAQQAAAGGLVPKGTCTFLQLPAVSSARTGDMWNISDEFVTTADFREGVGARYGAGANVYKTADGFWDVTAGQRVLMVGATANTAGSPGECNGPAAGDQDKFWRGDGSWADIKRSYVGMIIHSTTLDTMAKVIEYYGGTTWILHDGYMLRGASTGVTDNQAQSDGGQDTVTPTGTNSGGSVGSTTITSNTMPSHAHNPVLVAGGSLGVSGPDGAARMRNYNQSDNQNFWTTSKGGGQGHSHGFTQPTFTGDSHSNLPKYKNVYIWERTA